MQLTRALTHLLVSASLVGAPALVAADPTPTPIASHASQATRATAPKPADAAEVSRYAQLEEQSADAAKFEGGGNGIYIGGSALTIVLIVLLLIIIF